MQVKSAFACRWRRLSDVLQVVLLVSGMYGHSGLRVLGAAVPLVAIVKKNGCAAILPISSLVLVQQSCKAQCCVDSEPWTNEGLVGDSDAGLVTLTLPSGDACEVCACTCRRVAQDVKEAQGVHMCVCVCV